VNHPRLGPPTSEIPYCSRRFWVIKNLTGQVVLQPIEAHMSLSLCYFTVVRKVLLFSALVMLPFTVSSIAQAQGGRGNSQGSHAGTVGSSHPGHVQIFTAPNNSFFQGNFGFPKCCINGWLPNNPANSPRFFAPFSNRPFFHGRRFNNFGGGVGVP